MRDYLGLLELVENCYLHMPFLCMCRLDILRLDVPSFSLVLFSCQSCCSVHYACLILTIVEK